MNLEEIEELIFTIETKHKETLESYSEWSLLRNRLYMDLFGTLNNKKALNKYNEIINKSFFKNLFHGFFNWFRSYETLVFTNNQYRKFLEGIYFDRVVDAFIVGEEKNKTLFISLTDISFYPLNKIHSKYLVSQTFLDIFGFVFARLPSNNSKDYSKLQSILLQYDIGFNVESEIRQFLGYYRFYKFFFRLLKPKRIFVATYYSATRNYMVKAANDLGIEIIECQHGFIGDAHPSYNSEIMLDVSFIPKELWVFSEFDKKALKNRGVYKQSQIKIKGDYFLDHLRIEGRKKNEFLESYTKKYNYVVGISLQVPLEKKMIPFFIRAARLNSDIGYIFIPRAWNKEYSDIKCPKNILFLNGMNFYEAIFWCTHHSTVFSTTAIEAHYLGIPNILVDIEGFATKYLGTFFPKDSIINEEDSLIDLIKR